MSDEPKDNVDAEESGPIDEAVALLINVPGIGPKTARKLAERGLTTLEVLASAKAEELAEAIPGLSVAKASNVIAEAKSLLEAIASGTADITRKRGKRKKASEPEPVIHELPPPEEIIQEDTTTILKTGYDRDMEELGIPVGLKWLTRFERARIIGARALQISMGAPVLIDSKAPRGLFALAEAELKARRLPMTIRRTAPTDEYYDIPLNVLLDNTRLD